MAGDLENELADAVAEAVVRCARPQGGLRKSDAAALRKQARGAALDVLTELVTPRLMKLASLTERIEWLEEQKRQRAAGNGGWRG